MNLVLFVGGILAVAGSSTTTYFTFAAGGGSLGRAFRAYETRLERHASFLLLRHKGEQIARAQLVALSSCVATFLVTRSPACALLGLLVASVPPFLLWKRHTARVAKLERQLDTWLLMLANALKATSSVGEAIASTTALVPRPFSEEVDLLVKEIRLGVPLDRALHSLGKRVGSSVISGALMTIVVAQQTGGNLSDTLERASAALRESARLEGVLRTKTAEGRGQVLVLALVPFVLCLVIAWLDRSWFDPMLNHPYGRGILAACASAWTVATVWAHHIVGTEL
jgi:tight adherence protein B